MSPNNIPSLQYIFQGNSLAISSHHLLSFPGGLPAIFLNPTPPPPPRTNPSNMPRIGKPLDFIILTNSGDLGKSHNPSLSNRLHLKSLSFQLTSLSIFISNNFYAHCSGSRILSSTLEHKQKQHFCFVYTDR
jgi:hypothetical protein